VRAFEFQIEPPANGVIALPQDIADEVAAATHVKVIVLVENGKDEAWQKLTTEQFFRGYAPSDAIYDDLSAG
jgi:hypothetical protein